jgi:1-acyl-sn-glycerol-3-phosphate acyltransferase
MAHRPTPLPLKLWRFTRLLLHVLQGLLTVVLVFPRLDAAARTAHVLRWSGQMMQRIGIRFETNLPVQQQGNPDFYRHVFFAGNHVSWLDIHMLQSLVPARFVAKSELGTWPLLHRMIRASGAMFVERAKRRDVTRINDLLVEALTAGDCVAVFPEGTTSPGNGLRPFYANLIQAAIAASAQTGSRTDKQVQLIPFALRFEDADGQFSLAPAFIDDLNMVQSVWLTLGERHLTARLTMGEPIPLAGRHRKDVARDAEEAVRRLMGFKDGEGVLPRLMAHLV